MTVDPVLNDQLTPSTLYTFSAGVCGSSTSWIFCQSKSGLLPPWHL